MARSFLTKTESLSSAGYSNKSVGEKYGSIGAFLTRLEEFAELNEEIQEDVVELQNAVEAADEVEAVVEQQEANVAAMEGEEISSEPVKVESDGGEITEITPAQPDLSENSTPEEVTDVIVAEETKVERILQRLSRDQVRSKSEILAIYGINCHKVRTEDVRSNSLYAYKQKMEENKSFLAKIWEKIAAFFKKIWETIKNFFKGKAMDAKADEVKEKEEEVKKINKEELGQIDFDASIKNNTFKVSNIVTAMYIKHYDVLLGLDTDKLTKPITKYGDAIKKLINGISGKADIIDTLVNTIKTKVKGGLFNDIDKDQQRRNLLKDVIDVEMKDIVKEFKDVTTEVAANFKDMATGLNSVNSVSKKVNEAVEAATGRKFNGSAIFYAFSNNTAHFLTSTSVYSFKVEVDQDEAIKYLSGGKVNLVNIIEALEKSNLSDNIKKIKDKFNRISGDIDGISKDLDVMIKNKEKPVTEDDIYKKFLGEAGSETDAEKMAKVVHQIMAEFIRRSISTLVNILNFTVQTLLSVSNFLTFVISSSRSHKSEQKLDS